MSTLDYRLGIDVGGTNTDAVLLDCSGQVRAKIKVPTTADVTSGIIALTATARFAARRSLASSRTAGRGKAAAGSRSPNVLCILPVHSFATLLNDLATITASRVQPAGGLPAFTVIATPTPLQRQAFEFLGVSHHLGYA